MKLVIYDKYGNFFWQIFDVFEFLIESNRAYFSCLVKEEIKREIIDIDDKHSKFKVVF